MALKVVRGKYDVSSVKLPHPMPSADGIYYQHFIRNLTNIDICVHDANGGVDRIKSQKRPIEATPRVQIDRRQSNGQRCSPRHPTIENDIDGEQITINEWDLLGGPVYVQEVNLLICTPEQSLVSKHPHLVQFYHQALDSAIETLSRSDGTLTVRVFANDPTGTVGEVFIHRFGVTHRIKVTQYPFNEAQVTIIISERGEVKSRQVIALDQIADSDGLVEYSSGYALCIGLSEAQVNGGLAKLRDRLRAEPETVQKGFEDQEERFLQEKKMIEREHAAAIRQLKHDLVDAKAAATEAKREAAEATAYATKWKGLATAESDANQAALKTKTAEIGIRKEELAAESLVWKTVGGLAIAIATLLVKAYIDSLKSSK